MHLVSVASLLLVRVQRLAKVATRSALAQAAPIVTGLYVIAQQLPATVAQLLLQALVESRCRWKYSARPKVSDARSYACEWTAPAPDTLALLALAAQLYPPSDFRHSVLTPCLLFLGEVLAQARKNPVISICFATHPSKYRPPTTSLQPPSSTTTLYSLLQLLPSNKLPKATTVKQPPSNSHRICNPPITYSCPSHLIQWPTPLIYRLSQRSSRSPHCPNRFLASGVASSAATSRISTSSLRSALCRSSTV